MLILRFLKNLVCCVGSKPLFSLEFTAFLVNIFLLFYVYFHRCFRPVIFSSTIIFNCHWFFERLPVLISIPRLSVKMIEMNTL